MATPEPANKPKRRLKVPASTVRERAAKAQTASERPPKGRRLRAAASSSRRPFQKLATKLDRQPFRFLAKVLRFIGRIVFPRFIRSAFAELWLVTWPSRKETRQLTTAVILFAVVFGIVITAVDYGLDKLFKAVILK